MKKLTYGKALKNFINDAEMSNETKGKEYNTNANA